MDYIYSLGCGGHTINPNYETVCEGTSGHAEVVKVIYDEKNNPNDLLKIFGVHNPTNNRQGNDMNTIQVNNFDRKKDLIFELQKSKDKFQNY